MRYEMDSGSAMNGDQLGEEEWKTESDAHAAFSVPFRTLQDFLKIFFFSRSGGNFGLKNTKHLNIQVNVGRGQLVQKKQPQLARDLSHRRFTDGQRLKKKRYITCQILYALFCMLWMRR